MCQRIKSGSIDAEELKLLVQERFRNSYEMIYIGHVRIGLDFRLCSPWSYSDGASSSRGSYFRRYHVLWGHSARHPMRLRHSSSLTELRICYRLRKYCVRSNARVGIERDPFASNRENPVVNGSNNNAEVLGVCERRTSS